MTDQIKLIVGLGNPGKKYEYTRHNLGFLTLDTFLQKHAGLSWKSKFNGEFTQLDDTYFLKPLNFMNLSGECIRDFLGFYKLEPSHMLVIHDEADLEEGTIRLKKGGGSGGHNGLISILECIGTDDFYRIRVGVGKSEKIELADFLLEKANKTNLLDIAAKASTALESVFELGFTKAQNALNKKPVPGTVPGTT